MAAQKTTGKIGLGTARLVVSAAAAFGLAGALAACTTGSGPSSPAAGTTTAPVGSQHDVPNGAQLSKSLLTASALPTGFAADQSDSADSGATLSDAAPTVNLSSATCSTILDTLGQPGFGEASYADGSFTPASALGEFDETVFEFHGGGAADFITRLRAALGRCGSFDSSDDSGGVEAAKLTVDAAPKLGASALSFSVWVDIGDADMVMTDVAVQSGTAVVYVDNSTLSSSPDAINLTSLAGQLLQRLPAAP
jgi:hypothetical protein